MYERLTAEPASKGEVQAKVEKPQANGDGVERVNGQLNGDVPRSVASEIKREQ